MPVNFHYETVSLLLRKLLDDIMANSVFEPFYLVGGTSLSLRLGHRMSVDIDLFTNATYGSLDFSVYERFFQEKYTYYYCTDRTGLVGLGRSYYVGESKDENIKDVVSRGGRKKDFWDLHELLNTYSITQMLDLHQQRHEYTHDRDRLIANFTDFTSADKDIDPICLKGKEWELVKLDFVEIIESLK